MKPSKERLLQALNELADKRDEDSYGQAIRKVVPHVDRRFSPQAVIEQAVGRDALGITEEAAIVLLEEAGIPMLEKASGMPASQRFYAPCLRVLKKDRGMNGKEVAQATFELMGISPSMRLEMTEEGKDFKASQRVRFALGDIMKAGLAVSKEKGFYLLSEKGEILAHNPDVEEFGKSYLATHYAEFNRKSGDDENMNQNDYWLIAAGDSGNQLDEFLTNGYVAVDFGVRLDLLKADAKAIEASVKAHSDKNRPNNERALVEFSQSMEKGDRVYLKTGTKTVNGYGIIEGDYEFVPTATGYMHRRKVNWLSKKNYQITGKDGSLPQKTLTRFNPSQEPYKTIVRNFEGTERAFWIVQAAIPQGAADEEALIRESVVGVDWNDSERARQTSSTPSSKRTKRPRMRFDQMGIADGEELKSTFDNTTVKVVSGWKVEHQGAVTSLTALTKRLKGLKLAQQPAPFWTYKGKKLSVIYEQTQGMAVASDEDWQAAFSDAISPGDGVLVQIGESARFLVGDVMGEHRYDPSRESGRHLRDVKWNGIQELPTLIDYATSPVEEVDPGDLPATLKANKQGKSASKAVIEILYGPPGTGKTYNTRARALALCSKGEKLENEADDVAYHRLIAEECVAFITFHQNYDYSDFVEGYKPEVSESGAMRYVLRDGILKVMAERARNNGQKPHLLIIDEINRGNISKIFGELITLIEPDKREKMENEVRVMLPLSRQPFCLPANLHIIGTMNTADRSIALLDTALRRRFNFRRMDPDASHVWDKPVDGVDLQGLLKALNAKLAAKFGQDHQIGHAWFPLRYRKPEEAPDAAEVLAVLNDKILPLLDEWYYDEPREKAALFELLTERGAVTMAKLAAFAKTAA